MQCKCGSETREHDVVRQKEVVARYRRCITCGFVDWIWSAAAWPRERFQREDEDREATLL